ncbi:hypothetical protein CNR22_20015 [Sphingobacteriaceae bacterium]|nr:hypothetical protein CNR22_20015 [Sphingobacteriaceae bacterium]
MFKSLITIKPASFFIFAAVTFGILYGCVRPPLQSPDEFNHFCRAYQIAEGKFFPEKTDKRLGGQIPMSFDQLRFLYVPCTYLPDYKTRLKEMREGLEIKLSTNDTKFIDFPNTSYYSPVSYLPQSFAIFILKPFNPSVGLLYYGSRMFSYVVWLIAMFFVIRKLPIYKWLFALLILMPGDIYINNSFSADLMTNVLTLLLIAHILQRAFDDKPFTLKDFCWLLIFGILLALTKIVYISLVLLVFVIPAEKFGTRRRKLIYSGIIFIIACIVAQLWSAQIMKYYIPYNEYHEVMREFSTVHEKANYYLQKEHLKQHPFHFFEVILNSLFKDDFYLHSYIGRFGTFLDSPIPNWLSLLYYMGIIFVACTEFTKRSLSYFQKMVLFLSAFGTYALLLLTQHLTWNSIGNTIIGSFQGRYLVPIFPLIFLLLNNSWQKIKLNPALFVMVLVVFSNIYCCRMLYVKYINSFTEITELFYSADSFKEEEVLKMNGEIINVKGRSSNQFRSARYSVALAPDSSRRFIYKFNKAQKKDLVEIFFWRKGEGAEIEATGFESCSPYKFLNHNVKLKSDSGWNRTQVFFSFSNDCAADGEFSVFNRGNDTVYLDDFRFKLIRNK